MRVFLLVIIFSLFCFPLIGLAAPFSNAGFLQGGIWYSKDPFFAGETVRVYAALFNSGSEDIAGSVEFFDNGYSLGTSDFFVEHSGKFAQVWVDWNTSEGEHLVEAIITEASAIRIGKEAVPIQLQQNVAQQSARRVQMDSDGDGIGNDDDIDDDNDGISDAQELLQGTNPLAPLTPQEEAAIAGEKQEVKAKEDNTITETLIALLPDAVEVRAVAVHEAAQKMLVPVVKLVEEKKEEAIQGAEAIRKNPEARQTEKVQASLYAASLSGVVFILKTEALLYLVSLLFAYLFLRMILRRMFGRSRS